MIQRVMIARSWVALILVKTELAWLRQQISAETNNAPALRRQTTAVLPIAMEQGLHIAEILYARMEKPLPAVPWTAKQQPAVQIMDSIQGPVPLIATIRPAPMAVSLTILAVRRVVGLLALARAANVKA